MQFSSARITVPRFDMRDKTTTFTIKTDFNGQVYLAEKTSADLEEFARNSVYVYAGFRSKHALPSSGINPFKGARDAANEYRTALQKWFAVLQGVAAIRPALAEMLGVPLPKPTGLQSAAVRVLDKHGNTQEASDMAARERERFIAKNAHLIAQFMPANDHRLDRELKGAVASGGAVNRIKSTVTSILPGVASSSSSSSSSSSGVAATSGSTCTALADFVPQPQLDPRTTFLALREDDHIHLIDCTANEEWWYGRVGTKSGYFPAEFASSHPAHSASSSSSSSSASSSSASRTPGVKFAPSPASPVEVKLPPSVPAKQKSRSVFVSRTQATAAPPVVPSRTNRKSPVVAQPQAPAAPTRFQLPKPSAVRRAKPVPASAPAKPAPAPRKTQAKGKVAAMAARFQ